MTTHPHTASTPDDEKPFTHWVDRPARVFISRPAYMSAGMQPRTVDPKSQRPWWDNALLCAKRDLHGLTIGEQVNINGYLVERIAKGKHNEIYLIRGRKYTYSQAIAVVCESEAA